jgi:hypothetical protein
MLTARSWQPSRSFNGSILTVEPKLQAFECSESGSNQKSDFLTHKSHLILTLKAFFQASVSITMTPRTGRWDLKLKHGNLMSRSQDTNDWRWPSMLLSFVVWFGWWRPLHFFWASKLWPLNKNSLTTVLNVSIISKIYYKCEDPTCA